jgi:hypothetical protein
MTAIQPDHTIKDLHFAAVLALVGSLHTLKESEFPETLSLDFQKLSQLRNQFHFFVVSASMLDIVKDAIAKTESPDDRQVYHLLQTRCKCELTHCAPQALPRIVELLKIPGTGAAPELDIRQAT